MMELLAVVIGTALLAWNKEVTALLVALAKWLDRN